MALISCDECGREISDKAAACIGCGAPIAIRAPSQPSPVHTGGAAQAEEPPPPLVNTKSDGYGVWPYLALLAAGLLTLFFRLGSNDPAQPKSPEAIQAAQAREDQRKAERGIEYCEKRYKEMNEDRQYTPDVLRFHSQVCQKMREDYRVQWGREP